MDNNQETTRTCSQCHKEIAVINFSLHETHCSRFLCLCPDCNEAVPRDQLSEHRKEQHRTVRCQKCHQKMEQRQLEDHETDECVERLQVCEYCDLELPWKELKQHSLVCGSRTELCRDCGTYVKLSDRVTHLSTCLNADTNSTQGVPVEKGEGALTKIKPPGTQAEHKKKHEARSKVGESQDQNPGQDIVQSFRTVLQQRSLTDRDGGEDPDHISPCPHCHLALPLIVLRRHEAKCKIHNLLNKREDKHAAPQNISQQ